MIISACLQLYSVCLLQIEPYIPYEFTCEGMLQRVNILIEKQVGGIVMAKSAANQPLQQ